MNRNDDLLNIALKTEQAGCRKDDTQCCGKCKKPTYEELEAQVKQLAAENAALKQSEIEFNNHFRKECELSGDEWVDDFTETPATDCFLDSLRAEGVEMFAESQKAYVRDNRNSLDAMNRAAYCGSALDAERFAAQLRSKSEVQS